MISSYSIDCRETNVIVGTKSIIGLFIFLCNLLKAWKRKMLFLSLLTFIENKDCCPGIDSVPGVSDGTKKKQFWLQSYKERPKKERVKRFSVRNKYFIFYSWREVNCVLLIKCTDVCVVLTNNSSSLHSQWVFTHNENDNKIKTFFVYLQPSD